MKLGRRKIGCFGEWCTLLWWTLAVSCQPNQTLHKDRDSPFTVSQDTSDSLPDTAAVEQPLADVQVAEYGRILQQQGDSFIRCEIIVWDTERQRFLALSDEQATLYTIQAPFAMMTPLVSLPVSAGVSRTSVAVHTDGTIAVSKRNGQLRGEVEVLSAAGQLLDTLQVGYAPDQVLAIPAGFVVVNEGEGESVEAGGISLVTLSESGWEVQDKPFESPLSRAEFVAQGGHLVVETMTLAEEVEPEFASYDRQQNSLFVTLQEANAIAQFDLQNQIWSTVWGLGELDHLLPENHLDVSDRDDQQHLAAWPVYGMHQPDGIASFQHEGKSYLITANEGDSLVAADFRDAVRVKDLTLDDSAFLDADELQRKSRLGRLKVSAHRGDDDQDGDVDRLYAFGTRSYSIWDAKTGAAVFHAGNQLVNYLQQQHNIFNPDNASQLMDQSSDTQGIAPESIVVVTIDGHNVGFLGLENAGGVVILSLADPADPKILQYLPSRDFSHSWSADDAFIDYEAVGGVAPEGMVFVPAAESPVGKALLGVTYEQSGHIFFYIINP